MMKIHKIKRQYVTKPGESIVHKNCIKSTNICHLNGSNEQDSIASLHKQKMTSSPHYVHTKLLL